jgi:hypothetical protein
MNPDGSVPTHTVSLGRDSRGVEIIDLSDHVPLPHPKYTMTITTDPEKLKFLYRAIGRVFSQPRALGLLSAPPTVEEAEELLLSPVDDLLPAREAP